jgi:hypothetical protein
MQPLSKCPNCKLDLGHYVETHCPQCGKNFALKTPMTVAIWLLNLSIVVSGTLFVFGCMFVFAAYTNNSSRERLYEGEPYHATTLRVISVQYSQRIVSDGEQGAHSETDVYAIGIVEGRRESMDLLGYLHGIPRDQSQLMAWVPEGTVIPIHLFPTLKGQNRVQPIRDVPAAEWYHRRAKWASDSVFPIVGAFGILTALLAFARFHVADRSYPHALTITEAQ